MSQRQSTSLLQRVGKFRNEEEQLVLAMAYLDEQWRLAALSEDAKMPFELALEELFMNAVMHAQGSVQVFIRLRVEDGVIALVYEDDAAEFDPFTSAPSPNLSEDVAEREVGGLGVHLITQLFESHAYERCLDRNRITLKATADGG